MTLEEAIRHEEEMAECGAGSTRRADEHFQMAQWLALLQRILELPDCNTCRHTDVCGCRPEPGEQVRINCPMWRERGETI